MQVEVHRRNRNGFGKRRKEFLRWATKQHDVVHLRRRNDSVPIPILDSHPARAQDSPLRSLSDEGCPTPSKVLPIPVPSICSNLPSPNNASPASMNLSASRNVLLLWLLAHFLIQPNAAPEPPTQFSVQSPVDQSVFRLSDAQGQYVVLHFLLKTECPFCLRHTREYMRRAAELPQVRQVFLKPDTDQEILAWIQSAALEKGKIPPIYRDPDARLAEAYGIPGGYSFHGEKVHYPALILLNPEGREVFRYVGKDNSDRYGFDALAARIATLKATSSRTPAP